MPCGVSDVLPLDKTSCDARGIEPLYADSDNELSSAQKTFIIEQVVSLRGPTFGRLSFHLAASQSSSV